MDKITGQDGEYGAPGVDLTQEEQQAVADAKKEADAKRESLLEELVDLLVSKREIVVQARRDIERRWIDDQRQWDGDSRLLNTKEFPSQNTNNYSKPPRPHLTRARCDLWESRMIDLLVPTNEPTWDLTPMTEEDLDPPQGIQPEQWAAMMQAVKDDAKARATKMRDVIQDQMGACNATKALRKMCRDACRMGTGLIMGPMNGTHIRRKYNPNDENNPVKVQVEETIQPEIREADPWRFYPDMVSTADKAGYAFYLHPMDELELWNFSQFPGVNKDAVDEVLDEKPDFGSVVSGMKERENYSGFREDLDNRHAVWRYTGIIDRKYCEALDLEVEEGPVCADIWFCNRHVLKAKLTMLSAVSDFRIPYYVFSPFPIDDTMFGGSIPYMCRDSQRTADAAWLMGLHNLSVSSGPQMVIRKGKVVPADGKYDVRGPKIWYVTDDQVQVSDVFSSNNIANNAQQAFDCFGMAKQLMDEELNTAQWASPDTSEVTETASGLAMLMNARTILQRRVCACADDDVFSPLIQRFVLWNLLYSKRTDIKGNYDVRPLCQSVRLVKDIRIQQKLFVADNLAQNPLFSSVFNPYTMISDITRDLDVHVDNWLKPEQQWQQEQQAAQQAAQQDPQQQAHLANQQLLFQKTLTEQLKQKKLTAETIALPTQGQEDAAGQAAQFVPPEVAAKLQMHALDKQVDMKKAALDAQTQQYVAQTNLQSKREGIRASLHQARESNLHDLIKTRVQHVTKVTTQKMAGQTQMQVAKQKVGSFKPGNPKSKK